MTPPKHRNSQRNRMRALVATLALSMIFCGDLAGQLTLIPRGSLWQYWDAGTDLGTNWRRASFDDTAWSAGAAPLGYGRGDETTVIDPAEARPVTIYFRHTFVLTNQPAFTSMTFRLMRDDGAVVYINGREVYRDNLPLGSVQYTTLATQAVLGAEEGQFLQQGSSYGYLTGGTNNVRTNLVAIEIHQAAYETNDCRFDFELLVNLPLTPPTIQLMTPVDGQIILGNEVVFESVVDDLDGHVYRVDYFYGTNKVAEVNAPPFQYRWVNPPVGRYAMQAIAYDNSGRRGVSQVAHIQVGANVPHKVVRGPYLQQGTTESMILCWRTDWFTDSQVWIGPEPSELAPTAYKPGSVIDHQVQIDRLQPDTFYYYAVGTEDGILAGGSDYFFRTAPAQPRATHLWVIGDAGTATLSQKTVYNNYRNYSANRYTDLWLMLGDNAYEEGTDEEYQTGVFDIYPELLRQTPLWPTIGNHDIAYLPVGPFPYEDIFNLPTQGEAGGVPSGTERYYSFDFSNIHFVCLDSETSDRDPSGAMFQWLEQDLASTSQDWILAYWHHPPYTKGTHDSDGEYPLIEMRERALPILERHGVDLVLCGHSHVYERSFLLNGHYSYSSNLTSAMILDPRSGSPFLNTPYLKPAGGLGAHRGTVYAVCGCSGQGGESVYTNTHPAMCRSYTGFGSMVIDVTGLQLDGYFFDTYGTIWDWFRIVKNAPGMDAHPRLTLRPGPLTHQAQITWPTSLDFYLLEESEIAEPGDSWFPSPLEPVLHGRQYSVTIDLVPDQRWFRLRQD